MSRLLLSLACLFPLFAASSLTQADARPDHADRLPAALLAQHQKYPDCLRLDDPAMPRRGASFSARLDKKTRIYGILCEPSAYNWPYAIYIVRNGNAGAAERLNFAAYGENGWYGTNVLYNAYYNKENKMLQAFSKARGTGDCGSKSSLKWDGYELGLAEYRYKENCDGEIKRPFPLIYKRFIHKSSHR